MGIADQLDLMRGDFPDCASITFTDLATGLVLCASTRGKIAQERLDALCGRARSLLDGAAGARVAPVLGDDGPGELEDVILFTGTGYLLFLRSPVEGDEALCCECGPGIDLAAFLERARSELVAIGAAH